MVRSKYLGGSGDSQGEQQSIEQKFYRGASKAYNMLLKDSKNNIFVSFF